MRRCARPLLLLLALVPASAPAEIYRWTDAAGREHFTQDLAQVPAAQREAAEAAARQPGRLQKYERETPPASAAEPRRRSELTIPFERRGSSMWVYARVNDAVTAPFIVDTGASDVAIPSAVAAQAGIAIDASTPRAIYQTANGAVSHALVTLDSVEVGGVRVEGLRGSVLPGMSVGLLGASFFDNFTFQIDPAAQLITLVPNASVRSGTTEREWRERFRQARADLASVERYLEENRLTDDARVAALEEQREALASAIAALEREADRADVPQAWRE
jgi:clan AA aspartic protease (TIGR02281 family)